MGDGSRSLQKRLDFDSGTVRADAFFKNWELNNCKSFGLQSIARDYHRIKNTRLGVMYL
jgi:hypothetical protein